MHTLNENQVYEVSAGTNNHPQNVEGAISVATGGVGTLFGAIVGLYYSDAFGLNNPASVTLTLSSAFVGTTGALTLNHYYSLINHYIYGNEANQS